MTAKKIWTPEQVAAKMQEIIADSLGVDAEEVTPRTSLVDDLGADSLDVVELSMMCEETFKITIDESDAESFVTVSNVTDFVTRQLQRRVA